MIVYESAAHALAIGYVTDPGDTRALDCSDLSPEKRTFESMKAFLNAEMLENFINKGIPFDPRRPLELDLISSLMRAWNSNFGETEVVVIRADGTTQSLLPLTSSSKRKSVYIRLNNDRWEGCGYFQDPAPSASSLEPSSTMSAISHIGIEPAIDTTTHIENLARESDSRAVAMDNESIKSIVKFFHQFSFAIILSIQLLECWIEVLGLSSNETLRPAVGKVCSELLEVGMTARDLLKSLRSNATEAEIKAVFTMWIEDRKKEHDKEVEQKDNINAEETEDENVEDRESGDSKQKDQEQDGDNKQEQNKDDEDTKQKEHEDAKQREREEVQAIATEYATQDRYDSCSDSDEE
jgi:hypothetical protein